MRKEAEILGLHTKNDEDGGYWWAPTNNQGDVLLKEKVFVEEGYDCPNDGRIWVQVP